MLYSFVYAEQRKAESCSIRLKYPERVPVSTVTAEIIVNLLFL